MPEPVADFRIRVVDVLAQDRRRILLNWAGRVGALPAFRERPSLDLPAVLDNMSDILDDLLGLIRVAEPAVFAPDLTPCREHLQEHVRHRRAITFPCVALVQEFHQLRFVLWTEIAVAAPALRPEPGDVLDLEQRINYTLDAIVAATVDMFSRMADGI